MACLGGHIQCSLMQMNRVYERHSVGFDFMLIEQLLKIDLAYYVLLT